MSKPVGALARTLTDNVKKLQDRAIKINEEVQSSVASIDQSLTQAEETSAMLKKAGMELQAALGIFGNNPPKEGE